MGEYRVSSEPEEVLQTLLGSCVSACLYDPLAQVGGMNHFLLPEGEGNAAELRFGAYAMELLVNALLGRGALRSRLRAKLFGGADVLGGRTRTGEANARFALDYLAREDILHEGGSLGGTSGRRVQFWPASGRARQRLIEGAIPVAPLPRPAAPSVELF